ncbi:hypothetical protein V6R21_13905 [Limibacter armeniacum]|uniref:hypothetical protein n=1 Tax=Limibacter armeniacum TaxID=466084 RepID=UPI002FE5E3CA
MIQSESESLERQGGENTADQFEEEMLLELIKKRKEQNEALINMVKALDKLEKKNNRSTKGVAE